MRGTLLAALTLALAATGAAAAETPRAEEVLESVGFDAKDRERILAGEFIHRPVASATNRDLAIAMGFLVRTSPSELDQQMIRGTLGGAGGPNFIARGELSGAGTPDDFSGLDPSAAETRVYAAAKAGETVNFSSDELASLAALGGRSAEVAGQLGRILLGRYQAYRARGLAGIAPYDRGGGRLTDPAADLRAVSEAALKVKSFAPAVYRFLVEYPKGQLPSYAEAFHWIHLKAHGVPSYALTHAFSASLGGAIVFVQRQFYVSRGYNVEQAVTGFLPVKEGTLVLYTNHTSTDQVGGFGGSAKRSIGERLMASQLQKLFEGIRKAAEKR